MELGCAASRAKSFAVRIGSHWVPTDWRELRKRQMSRLELCHAAIAVGMNVCAGQIHRARRRCDRQGSMREIAEVHHEHRQREES